MKPIIKLPIIILETIDEILTRTLNRSINIMELVISVFIISLIGELSGFPAFTLLQNQGT